MWIINVFYCLHFGAADSRNCETNWFGDDDEDGE